jgi:hypothetical protein
MSPSRDREAIGNGVSAFCCDENRLPIGPLTELARLRESATWAELTLRALLFGDLNL